MCSDADDSQDGSDGVFVKLEGGGSVSAAPPRGLLAVLPHHLSAVNVVRWEPGIGARLASGSDLPTQSIIVWKREEAGSAGAKDSSTPFGMGVQAGPPLHHSAAGAAAAAASANSAAPSASPNVETWHPHLSLHGQSDITDLAWGPIGLHFRASEDPYGLLGDSAAAATSLGCVMDPPQAVRRRMAAGQGSQILASCSLDRSVVVWNVDTGDRHHLKGHSGWVLGVAFDPQGAFLATQSIDGFVWVWSLANFQLVRKIKDVGLSVPGAMSGGAGPRVDVGRTVSMARISWTPDGAALVACRGELKRGRKQNGFSSLLATASQSSTHAPVRHVSVVLNRTRNFDTQAVFGGHSGRTTVSAFNPVLFCTVAGAGADGKAPPPSFFSVLAIGSHDCVLSLWSTRRPTPLLLLTEVWNDGIVDLSWSGDGTKLLVASHDGSVVVLEFDPQVFEGRPATQQEQAERTKALYGSAQGGNEGDLGSLAHPSSTLASAHGLYDSPAALELQAQQKAAQQRLRQIAEQEARKNQALLRSESDSRKQAEIALRASAAAAPVASTAASTAASSTLSLQTEVRKPGAKRRIIPVSVPAISTDAFPTSGPFAAGAPVRSTSTSAHSAAPSAASQLAHATPSMLLAMTGGTSAEGADLFSGALPQQQPAKKRKIDDEQKTDAVVPAAGTAAASTSVAAASPAAPPVAGSSLLSAPRPVASSDELVLQPPPRQTRWLLHAPSSAAAASPFASRSGVHRWEFQVTDYAGRPLAAAAAGAGAGAGAVAVPAPSDSTLVSAFASAAAASSVGATVPAVPSRQMLWQSFVQHRVLMSVGNSLLLALACADTASPHFYLHLLSSASGRQLHVPLLLSAPPFLLSMRSSGQLGSLLVLTCDGLVRVYDLTPGRTGKRLRVQASVRTMLRSAASVAVESKQSGKSAPAAGAAAGKKKPVSKEGVLTIIAARLNSEDAPVIVLSNHASYVYDSSFECWTLVSPPATLAPSFPASDMRSELTLFQRTAEQQADTQDQLSTMAAPAGATRTATPSVPLSLLASMDARTRVLHSLAHLETDVLRSLQRGDASSYRASLTSYVAKLVSYCPALPSAVLKLTEVCRELQGPPSASAGGAAATAAASATVADSDARPALPPRWQPFVLGLSKRALLTALLPLLLTNPLLHTLVQELEQ